MGTATSSFEPGPPTVDLVRPRLFYGDDEIESKIEVHRETRLSPLGQKLLLLHITNQLPAAELFWVNRVRGNTPKQLKYFSILGQLYELFLTPHTLAIPPYKSCSYLKLYELYSTNLSISSIVN